MAGWYHKKLHNEKGGRHGKCKTQERYNKSFFLQQIAKFNAKEFKFYNG